MYQLLRGILTDYDEHKQSENNNNNGNYVRCLCGKLCKGPRGLRVDKRFCQVFDSQELHNLFNNDDNFIENSSVENISLKQNTPSEHCQTKPGVKLTKTNEQWSIANEYFKDTFDLSKAITDVDYELKTLQDNVYNYFKQTYGTVNNSDDDNTVTLGQRYSHLSKRKLKKQLAYLRAGSSEKKSPEIRYISKLIRRKYKKTPALTINDSNHDEKTFGAIVKTHLKKTT